MRPLAAVPVTVLTLALAAVPAADARTSHQPAPKPALTLVGTPVQGQAATLRVTSHVANGVKVRRTVLDFGDGRRLTRRVLSGAVRHAYARGGNYTARLTVTDVRGRTGRATLAVRVAVPIDPGAITLPAPAPAAPAPTLTQIDPGAIVLDATGKPTVQPRPVTAKLTVPAGVTSVPINLAEPVAALSGDDAPPGSGLAVRLSGENLVLDVAPDAPQGTTVLTISYSAYDAGHVQVTARTHALNVVVGPPGTPVTAENAPTAQP